MHIHNTAVEGLKFHNNADYSGDMIIEMDLNRLSLEFQEADSNGHSAIQVQVPFAVLRDYVMEYLRDRAINALQIMSPDELADYFTNDYNNEN
jgi:hypothetical protein